MALSRKAKSRILTLLAYAALLTGMALALVPPDQPGEGLTGLERAVAAAVGTVVCISLLSMGNDKSHRLWKGAEPSRGSAPPLDQFGSGAQMRHDINRFD